MKTFPLLASIIAATAAIPITGPVSKPEIDVYALAGIERRQTVGTTANEFKQGGCRDVIWFFAREALRMGTWLVYPSPLGSIVGPPTAIRLKEIFGSTRVAIQGIDYPALLSTNLLPGGADLGGIAEMRNLLTQAARDCPNSSILAGGYSQGAALTHRAIENLPSSVKDAIDGVVTFGDTKNLQDRGQIPNFPREKVKIFCNADDLVCAGTLTVTAAHFTYGSDANAAADFLAARARAGGA